MKNKFKIPIIFVLISLMIALSACNTDNGQNRGQAENTSEETDAQTKSTDIKNGEVLHPDGSVEIPLLTLTDYSEYEEFIDTHTLQEDFITYDQLSFLGEFGIFIYFSYYYGNYGEYSYTVIDENGYELFIRMQHLNINDEVFDSPAVLDSTAHTNKTDLRNIDNTATCYTMLNNVKYTYVQGKLLSLEWVENNIQYTLSGNGMLDNYPTDGNATVMSKLLTKSEASNAIAQIQTAINDKE